MKTVFAVDDSPTARASIEYVLKKENLKVELSEDGIVALEKLKSYGQVDVFLLDVNMPKMSGIELIREIRKIPQYKFTPILFLTTESQESMKMEGKNAGASGWIVKPYEPEQLLGIINRFIGA
ncbi:response regulator [Spirochaeta cellobiosiphila]|uniref:response regulator n=1 Tax=Spirochaeta cellobiosiphila TaxID=504483 RepID=UPI000415299C|nr:response regulator [Spirochaeta cellobiosiphila]